MMMNKNSQQPGILLMSDAEQSGVKHQFYTAHESNKNYCEATFASRLAMRSDGGCFLCARMAAAFYAFAKVDLRPIVLLRSLSSWACNMHRLFISAIHSAREAALGNPISQVYDGSDRSFPRWLAYRSEE